MPRGLLEAGPFEEAVQTCAVVPFAGDATGRALEKDDFKARLHCWKFDRPTCEEMSKKPEKFSIHRSNVFDAYDALMHARRTQDRKVWSLFDLKDAEKLEEYEKRFSFADTARDEGVFGVRDFCRFVSYPSGGRGKTKIQCGYTRRTMAQWYELHQNEPAEGCSSGVCVRGSYRRGYFCGLFASTEYFAKEVKEGGRRRVVGGKPIWICGIDTGLSGRRILGESRAICVGGARAKRFQSAKRDRTSLQCYERRFRWGESEQSEDILRLFDWGALVAKAAEVKADGDQWLAGGTQAAKSSQGGAVAWLFGPMRKSTELYRKHAREDGKEPIASTKEAPASSGASSTSATARGWCAPRGTVSAAPRSTTSRVAIARNALTLAAFVPL